MSDSTKENTNKTEKAIVATVGSSAMTGIGIGLMFLGPIGMVAGGILMSAGVSSGVNTAQQVISDQEDFDLGSWGKNVGIGAATGLVAAPFALGGAALSAGMGTAAKTVTTIAAGSVGGTASGATSKVIQNKCDGKDWDDGIGTAMVTGLVAGGVGSGIG